MTPRQREDEQDRLVRQWEARQMERRRIDEHKLLIGTWGHRGWTCAYCGKRDNDVTVREGVFLHEWCAVSYSCVQRRKQAAG